MSETLMLLYVEHGNMRLLLDILEEQADGMKNGRLPDYGILTGMADYLNDYPDQCHHPIEDLILRKMLAKAPAPLRDPGLLLREHEKLSALSNRFRGLVHQAVSGNREVSSALAEAMDKLVEKYRQHIKLEEDFFFPEAQKSLSRLDWYEIDHDVFDRRDPLFDNEIESGFSELRNAILSFAAILRRRSFDWLAGVSTISEFNSREHYADRHFQLQRSASGNFLLLQRGQRLLEIPRCNEREAVWCAFYYLEGVNDAITGLPYKVSGSEGRGPEISGDR